MKLEIFWYYYSIKLSVKYFYKNFSGLNFYVFLTFIIKNGVCTNLYPEK